MDVQYLKMMVLVSNHDIDSTWDEWGYWIWLSVVWLGF